MHAAAELPRVVVEASRTGKTPAEIPAAVQVVSRAEIAASGARDLADLLQKKSATLDFAHLGANNPALTQLAPRGYGENGFGRLLVMVDGERLNSPDMNAPNLKSRGYGYWYTDFDIYSYAITPEWINTARIAGFDNELVVGATFRYDRNDAANWGTSSYGYSHSKYEYDRQTMGFYAQDTFKLTDQVSIEVGGRYERSWNKCTMANDPRRSYDLAAYDAALLFAPAEGLKTYFKFSNFYRMPFIDEVAFNSRDDLLSPERGWRVDAGFDWSFLEEFSLAANAFVSRTKNEIFYDSLFPYSSFGWTYYGDNVNSPSPVMREGFDIRAAWERDKVAGVAIAYSYVDAEFDGGKYDGNDVPMAAESVVTASAKVWLWDDCFVFGGYRFRSECFSTSDFGNEYEKVPSCGLFNAGVQYAPTLWNLDGLVVTFTVDNLFDKDYCDYTTYGRCYWPAAGRSYMLSVRYEF